VCGAFAALLVGNYENNIYAQIGLVMLIGLSAKNSILIVEFAKAKTKRDSRFSKPPRKVPSSACARFL